MARAPVELGIHRDTGLYFLQFLSHRAIHSTA